MAVPPRPGNEVGSSSELGPRNGPSPQVPRALPDNSRRAGTTAVVLIVAALIVIALLVLL